MIENRIIAGRDIEIDEQHAEQDHPARHPEHAGDETRRDDGDGDEGEVEGGHAGRTRCRLLAASKMGSARCRSRLAANGLALGASLAARAQGMAHADRASAPSIMSTVFSTPYTATNEPKRGPFSWPSSTW